VANSNKSSINILHPQSGMSIGGDDKKYIQLSINGGVKVGTGKNLPEDIETNILEYTGAIRFNEKKNTLQFCDGTRWVDFILDSNDIKPSIVYSMIF